MHLDARSHYSFHLGVSAPAQLVAQAAELGHKALGLCDIDGTYGLHEFYRAAVKCEIRPVLGIGLTAPPGVRSRDQAPIPSSREALQSGGAARYDPLAGGARFIAAGNREKENAGSLRLTDKNWAARDTRHGQAEHIPRQPDALVLAQNRDGYSQLCALAAGRQLDPQWDMMHALEAASDHCFVVTDREELLRRLAPRLGPKQLFVRLSADYGPAYRAEQLRQARLAERYRLEAVASTDVCFTRPQDRDVHHLLCAIGQNTSLHFAQGVRPAKHYLSAPTEFGGLFYQHPAAVRNARLLAEHCNVELLADGPHFPQFPVGRGETPEGVLRELCRRCLRSRYKDKLEDKHRERLEMELGVISELKFSSYFLFVFDLLQEAHRRGISCLGRGSAANSIVSFVLGLTPLDPLHYDMYFERFLNPQRRHSPPDIDIDFNWKRRGEIIQYIYDKWGSERVALISTHVTYRSRSALRETAKVFGLGDGEISELSRYMPGMHAARLGGKLEQLPELNGINFNVEPYNQVLPLAARLAGKPRHLGIHCGGVVIAPGKITDFTGLQRAAKGFVVTQYEMHAIEGMGLVKLDVLGNRSLGVREDLLGRLAWRGEPAPITDLAKLTQDRAIQGMLSTGQTMGCFYIESPAMRQLLKQLKTKSFRGLTAASSVIRPGVAQSGMMQEYIRRVNDGPRKLPSHPLVEQLLTETEGVMVFQEDVMRVAHKLAGFSPAEADLLRRAMNGKLRGTDKMHKLEKRWQAGCEANGVDRASADEIWRQLSSFSEFSFCKAHSASFATLSYQMAWLKAHYPADFMAAVITNGGGFYGAQAYLSECRRLGLAVLPPDVNASEQGYTAETAGAVRVGLGVIRNVPIALLERIPRERERRGPFASLRDFVRRVRPQRAELEVLILSGVLDSLGCSRPELLWQAGLLGTRNTSSAASGQLELQTADGARPGPARATALHDPAREARGTGAPLFPALTPYSTSKLIRLETEHLGLYVSCHPLTAFPNLPTAGIIQAVDLPRYAGRRVHLLGWCIATKRVNVDARIPQQDPLALQTDEYDLPENQEAAAEDEEAPSNAAADIGLIARESDIYSPRPYAMKFMSMEDTTGTYEATLFPQAYARFAHLTRMDGPFIVSGLVEEHYGACSVNCHRLELIEQD